MDEFRKAGAKEVEKGISGKETKSSDFAYNSSRGQKPGFSKLRRSRLKQNTNKEINKNPV